MNNIDKIAFSPSKNGEFLSLSIVSLNNEIIQFLLNKLKHNWLKKL